MEFLQTAFRQVLNNNSNSVLSLAHPQWDGMIFLFIFITTLFYGLGLTRNKILIFIFSTYMAMAIVDSLPFIKSWWSGLRLDSELGPGFIFLAILIFIAAFVLAHMALKQSVGQEKKRGPIMYNFLLSLLHVGLITSVILSSFPNNSAAAFSPFTQRLFMGNIARFFWFIIPLLTIILFNNAALNNESSKSAEHHEEE